VQNKWSSDALHRRAGVVSFQFPRKCLNRAGRFKYHWIVCIYVC